MPVDGAGSTRCARCARLGKGKGKSGCAACERLGCPRETSSSSSIAATPTSPYTHLVAGSIAGGLSRTVAAPLETVRVRLMTGAATGTGSMASPSILGMLRDIAKHEGVRALWKGNAAVVARFAPTKGLDFFTFNLYKGALATMGLGPGGGGDGDGHRDEKERRASSLMAQRALAGGLAGATSTALLFPLDNIATRLATSAASGAAMVNGVRVVGALGLLHAARRVADTEGVAGLYRGFRPAVLGIIPEAAITYGSYDALKEWCGRGAEPGVVQATLCGMVAALAGTAATFPAAVVSRRMIIGSVPGYDVAVGRMGLIAAMRSVAGAEGVGSLYRGLGTASVRLVPLSIVSFASYEWTRRVLDAKVREMNRVDES